jgi:flagellar biosynthesis/type III secretory pathway protein FliH
MNAVTSTKPIRAQIEDYIVNAALPVSRQELGRALPFSSEQIRKCTAALVRQNRITTEVDKMGVPRYVLPKKKAKPKLEMVAKFAVEEVSPGSVEKVIASTYRTAIDRKIEAYDTKVEEAYTRGYNDGVFLANRDGYNAGRKSVLKSLTKLLGIDCEILL